MLQLYTSLFHLYGDDSLVVFPSTQRKEFHEMLFEVLARHGHKQKKGQNSIISQAV